MLSRIGGVLKHFSCIFTPIYIYTCLGINFDEHTFQNGLELPTIAIANNKWNIYPFKLTIEDCWMTC